MQFPTIQTYASGEEVRWIDEPVAEGEEEPERPAPTLTLVHAEGEGDGGAAADGADEGESASGLTVENTASQDDVDSANTLATVGIAAGIIGLLVALFAVFKGRKAA